MNKNDMRAEILLVLARISLTIVIFLCLRSGLNIWAHSGGEDRFLSMLHAGAGAEPSFGWAIMHARLHFGREAILLCGAILGVTSILFSSALNRTPHTWFLMLVLLVAATGGHWIAGLTTGADTLPSAKAMQNHVGNTVCALLVLVFSAKDFFSDKRVS